MVEVITTLALHAIGQQMEKLFLSSRMMMILTNARALLIKQEGLKLKPYTDTTGNITIGVGRNLSERGISEAEALHLLANDLVYFTKELTRIFAWYNSLDDVRKLAILSMAFNLGLSGLLAFKGMLAACQAKDWLRAYNCALDSVWAKQTGTRAQEIANMLKTGELPHGLA